MKDSEGIDQKQNFANVDIFIKLAKINFGSNSNL